MCSCLVRRAFLLTQPFLPCFSPRLPFFALLFALHENETDGCALSVLAQARRTRWRASAADLCTARAGAGSSRPACGCRRCRRARARPCARGTGTGTGITRTARGKASWGSRCLWTRSIRRLSRRSIRRPGSGWVLVAGYGWCLLALPHSRVVGFLVYLRLRLRGVAC